MAGLYVFSRSYQQTWSWLEWLRAFSEAGMVGGLADWFAVTALFRHPLGLPIPHTAVIPREKDRIGRALAQFVRGNFLTSERICKQIRELKLIPRLAQWMILPEKSNKVAHQVIGLMPAALDALEKHDTHRQITSRLIDQLRAVHPNEAGEKLLAWLMSGNRYRQVLAPLLVQLACALSSNKERIEQAAGRKAPMKKIPLLGKISKAIAEDISERATGSVEEKLLAASQDTDHPLWDIIYEQLVGAKSELSTNPDLRKQLEIIRDQWLDDPQSRDFAVRLWQQLRQSLEQDLNRESPHSVEHLSSMIKSIGTAIDQNHELAQRIETIVLEGITQILDQHGQHLETMIRETIEEWDPDTLMKKLEHQVGPDLQYIRINGTLIGGLVGISLHAIGKAIW
ncbi:MAG: DUF445 domain-containing protein [Verrucomicrobiae bacterium]|nr:DUF445 domain-containing protein [Verrucomicrobiae bacterium]NNJ87611.1 DUF445 domain-containing protein [Akkermansiaceae bacterium]